MTERVLPEVRIQRILVALDASVHSEAALQWAVELAALLEAEVTGLFVEDVDLLRVAQLPFVREIRYPVAAVHDLDVGQMETHWQQQARQVKRLLEEAAADQDVAWTFRVERGRVSESLAQAANSADLVVLGRLGRAIARRRMLGSTARRTAWALQQPVLLMRAGVDFRQPVVLLYDGSATADRALKIATTFATKSGDLHVLVWARSVEGADAIQQRAEALLAGQAFDISFQRIDPEQEERLLDLTGSSPVAMLILPHTGLTQQLLTLALERLSEPLLVVR